MGTERPFTGPVRAVVQGTAEGEHGPYAWSKPLELEGIRIEGHITFSLLEPVWKEGDTPEEGSIVILDDIRRKTAGWRAMSARYERPSDNPGLPQK